MRLSASHLGLTRRDGEVFGWLKPQLEVVVDGWTICAYSKPCGQNLGYGNAGWEIDGGIG